MEGGHPGEVGSAIDTFYCSSTSDDEAVVDRFVESLGELAADSEQMWQESSGTGAEADCLSYLDLGFEPDGSVVSSVESDSSSDYGMSDDSFSHHDTDSVSDESASAGTMLPRSRDVEDTALYSDTLDATSGPGMDEMLATSRAVPVETHLLEGEVKLEQKWGCNDESLHAPAEECAGGSEISSGDTFWGSARAQTTAEAEQNAVGAHQTSEAVPADVSDAGTADADTDPICPHCPLGGRTVRSKNKDRAATRKSNLLQSWYSSYGYTGPPYCKRCSEAFNNHLLRRSAKGKNRAGCTRASHCSQCQKILAHVQDVDNMWKLAGKKHVWNLAEKESRLQEKWARSSQR